MSTTLCMVLVVRPWSSVQVCVAPFGGKQLIRGDGLGMGFLPVFETYEDAKKFAEGDESLVYAVARQEEER